MTPTTTPEGERETSPSNLISILRADSLANFYSAERRAGACPLVANERMMEFAKRFDALYEQKLNAVKTEMERVDE